MGIYDREYYRSSGPSFLESISTQGKVCKWLIFTNVVVFVLQLLTRQHGLIDIDGVLRPYEDAGPITNGLILNVQAVLHGQVWRLLTYAFLHDQASILHIAFNMLFLWWFGKDVEDLYGPKEFLAIYLVSAVLGGIAFTLWGIGRDSTAHCLGASGAVTAVMVLFACHYPTHVIHLWWFLPVPIWLFVLFLVGRDALALINDGQSNVAVQVHLAGAAFGYGYHRMQWRLLNFLPTWSGIQRSRRRTRLRVYQEESPQQVSIPSTPSLPTPTQAPAVSPSSLNVDEQLEAKMDAVLEKVKQSGMGSLTDGERKILLRASEVMRKKRT